jgi:radical SAM-linked protein
MSDLTRLVVTYRKTGRLRFIGHLDLCRGIERAMRRAALPIAYTQGFHERMRIAHGPALPVGGEGLGEIFVATLAEPLDGTHLLRRLVRQFPDDLGIVSAVVEPESAPLILKSLRRATYDLTVASDPPISGADLSSAIDQALAAEHLEAPASAPNKPSSDIRPRIFDLAVTSVAPLTLTMNLSIAGDSYLGADRCLQALARLLPTPSTLRWVRLIRTGMFAD